LSARRWSYLLFDTSSWSYYGEQCFEYLFGGGRYLYRLLWTIGIIVGALGGLRPVWALADSLNALMILPNLIGLLGMSDLLVRLNRNSGKITVFRGIDFFI